MAKLTLAMSVLAGATALCGAAAADSSMVGPTYIGDHAADPEDETFAYLVKPEESDHPIAFIGPVRNFGPVTGYAEKDTIGYLPLLAVQRDGFLVICARARVRFQKGRGLWIAACRRLP